MRLDDFIGNNGCDFYLLRWDTKDLGIFKLTIDQSRGLNLEEGNELFGRMNFLAARW